MSKIKNSGLDQYGAEPFKQQQFGTSDVHGVKTRRSRVQQGSELSVIHPHCTKPDNLAVKDSQYAADYAL